MNHHNAHANAHAHREIAAPSWPVRALLIAIGAYKILISPLLPRACRFEPSCSVYAGEAIRRYGLARGIALAAKRLARCRPGVPGGIDLVP
jgi:putative membrane protein insertion efficiency factor